MSKTTVAAIVFAILACAALAGAAFTAGRNAGREQTQLDRVEAAELRDRADIDELKAWKNRWGSHGAPGAEAPGK